MPNANSEMTNSDLKTTGKSDFIDNDNQEQFPPYANVNIICIAVLTNQNIPVLYYIIK